AITKTGGATGFTPYWRVLDSTGNGVAGCNANSAAAVGCRLAAGAYRVAASDRFAAATGSYDLMLTRRSAPCEDTTLPCDTATAGTIEHVLDRDRYSFTSPARRSSDLAITKTGGATGFTPYWTLLDATGNGVAGCNANSAAAVGCRLAAGTYRVEASDRFAAATGSYDLMLTRRSAPCEGTPLRCDTATAGT